MSCPYNVIHFNEEKQHQRYREDKPLMKGLTSSGKEIAEKAKAPIPNYNPDRAKTYDGIRRQGIVEKCTFCDHRVKEGKRPWCVEACPAGARIFGDLNDKNGEVNQLLAKYSARRLRENKGTEPKVFYIRDF
jgi:molybdopterin-containing oxidoreductase family iron-sulfur binding subunit